MNQLKSRVLLVSDMHYSTEQTHEEMLKIDPKVNTSVAAGNAFGFTQRQKIKKVYDGIIQEYNAQQLDAVLILGDLSIDDFDWRNLPTNYCRKFKNDCMDRLPCPSYALAGNHDSYPEEIWKEIFGYGRQYTLAIHDMVFIMLDTFRGYPATGGSGAKYTQVDVQYCKNQLKRYAGKRIFLCAHYFNVNKESEEFKQIVRESKDIVCLYQGHTHCAGVIDLGPEYGNKKLCDIGGYGYYGMLIDGKYDFNQFDEAWAWGYQILEVYCDKIVTYHCRPDMHYVASNGTFDIHRTRSGITEFSLISE